ncbi:hypothetical protein ANCCEY_04776 [Ancylostoma ceylanicum]|uniref:SSD domain-containing protein n=1 Tax=Ancylostoma ceylanicum TaxID=53326 RepID=A0A0D6LVL2_9BILA|nr:hypothetical protein ANCCEY_04776 [Ancylostoma ceylanicum]
MAAVGVDNVFILLSAWRSSPSQASLEKRMEETFADAGVSITVTSLTDFISFAVGCATPFPSVQEIILETYSDWAKMAEDRSFEKNHVLSQFFRTTYSDMLLNPYMFCAYAVTAVVFTYIYQLTFFAGIMVYTNRREMDNRNCLTFRKIKKDTDWAKMAEDRSFEKNHVLSQFFRTTYSDMLLNPYGIATWGCTEVKLGLEPNDLLPDNSYGKRTLRLAEKYFSDYGSSLHVWMYNLSKVDYGSRRIDVVFDEGSSSLYASRVPVQLRHVGCANQSRAMHLFRRLAETSEIPTGFAEQYNAVLPGTLSSIAYAGGAVVIVSLLLIPEPVASLWVSFSIISINIGILGFMTFWSVRLDFISMVTIVMSIGFCVDFAAHLAYNFAKGRNLPPSERMRNALYAVGAPILQSATSTILGVSFLASAESYVFRSFLKTIFLVILLGVLHGLVILPVLLTMFHCSSVTETDDVTTVAKSDTKSSPSVASSYGSPPVKYLSSPDLYKFPPSDYPLSYLDYRKDLGRPPDYNEPAPPYPMRARLKYPRPKVAHTEREAEYCYHNPAQQPRVLLRAFINEGFIRSTLISTLSLHYESPLRTEEGNRITAYFSSCEASRCQGAQTKRPTPTFPQLYFRPVLSPAKRDLILVLYPVAFLVNKIRNLRIGV